MVSYLNKSSCLNGRKVARRPSVICHRLQRKFTSLTPPPKLNRKFQCLKFLVLEAYVRCRETIFPSFRVPTRLASIKGMCVIGL